MKPTAADAMQWRALGSRLLERKPALNSFERRRSLPRSSTGRSRTCRRRSGPRFFSARLELLGHDVEGFVPRHRRELAVLVVLAVLLAQHRLGQAVVAVHDLGEEIALDAVEPAIDLGLDVAVGGDHAIVLGRHHHAAAGAAEPARRLVPFQFARGAVGDEVRRRAPAWHAARQRRHRGGLQLQNLAAVEFGCGHGNSLPAVRRQPASMA